MLTVGVYDSGIGGLCLLKTLTKTYPYVNFIYMGDNSNAPYGNKEASDIFRLAYTSLDTLCEYNPNIIIIACNTVSTVCGESLKNRYSTEFMFVKPPEIIKGEKVLVAGTPDTIKNLTGFKRQPDKYTLYSLPALAGDIERNVLNLKKLDVALYFKNLSSDYDRVYLACTHYPFVRKEIKKRFPNSVIDDGLAEIKTLFKKRISELNPDKNYNGTVVFIGKDADKNKSVFKKVLKVK